MSIAYDTRRSRARKRRRREREKRRIENAYAGHGMLFYTWILGAATGVLVTLSILQYNGAIYLHI
jgi:hypothetical protein